VSKRLIWDVFKYLLAVGLLVFVIWQNWGERYRVAGRIVPGQAGADGGPEATVTGVVQSYSPDHTLTLETPAAQRFTFALVPSKTHVEAKSPEAALAPGETVTVWEHPGRGVGYVWQRHVVEGEPIHLGYLGLAFLFFFISMQLTFLRWYFLVRAQDLPFRLSDGFRLGFVGFFFNSCMPGSVGGDIIKAAFLVKEQKERRTIAVATIIMDRAIALWALVWFVALFGGAFWALGLLHGPEPERAQFIIQAAACIVGVTLAVWIGLGFMPQRRAEKFAGRLSRIPKVGAAASEFWWAVWMYRCRQSAVAVAFLISWVGFVGFVLSFYFSALTLWDATDSAQKIPSLAEHFLLVPIGLVIEAMPLFPGGAGIGELGFGELYKWLGASVASGVLGSLVYRMVKWVLGAVGYIIYLQMRSSLVAERPAALATEEGTPEWSADVRSDDTMSVPNP
jgi:uncharacterized protein (TIRG00374 family)